MIEIERVESDRLTRQVWCFGSDMAVGGNGGPLIYLQSYACESRPTRRHQWRRTDPDLVWTYRQSRERREHWYGRMPVEHVPLPRDVRQQAIEMLMARAEIYVGHWNRRDAQRWIDDATPMPAATTRTEPA